jgi:hypothetical protein
MDYALKRMNPRRGMLQTNQKASLLRSRNLTFLLFSDVKASFFTVLKAKKPASRLAF